MKIADNVCEASQKMVTWTVIYPLIYAALNKNE